MTSRNITLHYKNNTSSHPAEAVIFPKHQQERQWTKMQRTHCSRRDQLCLVCMWKV